MVRLSFLILGYRRLSVSEENVAPLCAELMRNGISLQQISENEVLFSEANLGTVCSLCDEKYEILLSGPLGFFGCLKRMKYKRGGIIGLVLAIALTLFLQNLVWDVRIDGEDRLSDDEVKEMLSHCGLEVGSRWNSLDRSVIEADVLSEYPSIAWININRRGTVAYVEVIEREKGSVHNGEQKRGYANLVASEGCVIEEITVTRGVAQVKAGDVVKKGDILISGISADGGFCYAEGEVIGRVDRRIEVKIPRSYEKEVSRDRFAIKTDIKIFNFPINIFKKYGNSHSGCDIIEDKKVFSLFDVNLPISFNTSYAISRVTEKADYSDEELAKLARHALNEKTLEVLGETDLLRIRTNGEFDDEGYFMYSDVVMLTSVGEALEFNLN